MCLCVGRTGELCESSLIDGDAVWGILFQLDGVLISRGKGTGAMDGWQDGDAAFCQITLDTVNNTF